MKKQIISLALAASVCLSAVPAAYAAPDAAPAAEGEITPAAAEIRIDQNSFPDFKFLELVRQFDTDRNGFFSQQEREAVEMISTAALRSEQRPTNLTGIALFPNLRELLCSNSWDSPEPKITELDVSRNSKLETLACSYQGLTHLDVSSNPELKRLECISNQLTNLDVTKNPLLERLVFDNNQVAELDVSRNPKLYNLACKNNRLTGLDVGMQKALRILDCGGNQLTELDVSGNPALEVLTCEKNQLKVLDVSGSRKLEQFNAAGNQLACLTVPTKLNWFEAKDNVHTAYQNPLDLTALEGFDVSRASGWQGGSVSGDQLTFEGTEVTYTYDCGQGQSAQFRLVLEEKQPTGIRLEWDTSGLATAKCDANTGEAPVFGTLKLRGAAEGDDVHLMPLTGLTTRGLTAKGVGVYPVQVKAAEKYQLAGADAAKYSLPEELPSMYAVVMHNLTEVPEKPAECTKPGTLRHWKCSGCGRLFADAEATQEIQSWNTIINPRLHSDRTYVPGRPPMGDQPGVAEHWHCNICGKDLTSESGFDEIADVTLPAEYKITFRNADGSLLSEMVYPYGAQVLRPAEPAKPAGLPESYVFTGWTPEITDCTQAAEYTAVYGEKPAEGGISGDINRDGKVDSNDAAYLMLHVLYGDKYPLNAE